MPLLLFSVIIFLTIPYVPVLWNSLEPFYKRLIVYSLYISCAAVLVSACYKVFRQKKSVILRIIFIAVISYMYVLLFSSRNIFPAEKVHLAEYGLLLWFAYRFFKFDNNTVISLTKGFALVSCISIADEAVQWLTPKRVGTVEDVILNIESTLLVLCIIAVTRPPEKLKALPGRRELVHLTYYFGVFVIMLALFMGYVHDFGYEIDEGKIYFYSAFESSRLFEIANILQKDRKYFEDREILAALNSGKPSLEGLKGEKHDVYRFFKEASLHITERNIALEGRRYAKAASENAIIEKYYSPIYGIVKSKLRPLKTMPNPSPVGSDVYRSPVGRNLIYQISEWRFYVVISGLIIFFAVANICLRIKQGSS